MPVAVNCCVLPLEIEGLAGVIAMDWSVAAVTVRTSAGEVTPVKLAVILLVPVPTPVANPAALIVATVVVPEFHVTWLVMFAVVVSLYVPVAVNCCVLPLEIEGLIGVMAMD